MRTATNILLFLSMPYFCSCLFKKTDNGVVDHSIEGEVCEVEKSAATFDHYLLLKQEDYQNLSIGQLLEISYQYLDTCVLAYRPIGSLHWMTSCQGFTEDTDHRQDDLIDKQLTISLYFETVGDSILVHPKLRDLTLWKNGKSHTYLGNYKEGVFLNIDSISNRPLKYFYNKYF